MQMSHATLPADALHHRIRQAVQQQWHAAGLPGGPAIDAQALQLGGDGSGYPSSFAVDVAASASVAAATLAAAQLGSLRSGSGCALACATVQVPHALAETTGYFTLDGVQPDLWSPISGLYPCGAAVGRPGWVRIHANFDHHRDGALQLLGLPIGESTSKQAVAQALDAWDAIDFETQAAEHGLVVAAARTPQEWAAHPQSAAVAAQPLVQITQLDAGQPAPPRAWPGLQGAGPLSGIQVLDLTRILSGPVAARTLAAHGAEVLMINGPGLPNIGAIADLSRGKRSALLDLKSAAGKAQFASLLDGAHVLLQGYHPGSLDALGFGPQQAAQWRPGIVYASLSAYGRSGPWADRRGFDSLVQTASGINWAEGQAFEGIAGGIAGGRSSGLRALPMQILDYAAGFWLAFGIQAALYRQATQGGSWHVQVSLAHTAQWLRELGQRPVLPQGLGDTTEAGLAARMAPYLQTLASGFGTLTAVRHSGVLGGVAMPWRYLSMPPGSAAPQWP